MAIAGLIVLGGCSGRPPQDDGSVGSLVITTPGDGEIVSTSTVNVRGTASPGAEIVQDISFSPDERTVTDADGEWSITVELDEGENELTFRIGDDEATAETITVIFAPDVAADPEPTNSGPADTPAPEIPPPEPQPAFEPVPLSGVGDAVPRFDIPVDQAAIATVTHTGASNFAIFTVGEDGSQQELLVNTIGNYGGTVLFDASFGFHSAAFEITADGAWTVEIKPVSMAYAWDPAAGQLAGQGDDVVLVQPPVSGLMTAAVTHTGSGNFAVIAYSTDSADLLINEIGSYSGEVLVGDGTFLLQVTADGSWTVTPS